MERRGFIPVEEGLQSVPEVFQDIRGVGVAWSETGGEFLTEELKGGSLSAASNLVQGGKFVVTGSQSGSEKGRQMQDIISSTGLALGAAAMGIVPELLDDLSSDIVEVAAAQLSLFNTYTRSIQGKVDAMVGPEAISSVGIVRDGRLDGVSVGTVREDTMQECVREEEKGSNAGMDAITEQVRGSEDPMQDRSGPVRQLCEEKLQGTQLVRSGQSLNSQPSRVNTLEGEGFSDARGLAKQDGASGDIRAWNETLVEKPGLRS